MHCGICFFVSGGCNERNYCVPFLENLLLIRRFFFFTWERLMFSVSSRSDPDENNFSDSLGFFLFFRPPLPPTGIEPEPKKISFESIWINSGSIWMKIEWKLNENWIKFEWNLNLFWINYEPIWINLNQFEVWINFQWISTYETRTLGWWILKLSGGFD